MDVLAVHPLLLTASLLLAFKHAVADGPLQTSWIFTGKGTFGHPAGLTHAAAHGVGTLVALAVSFQLFEVGNLKLAMLLAAADAVVHYLIDYAKIRLSDGYGWAKRSVDADGNKALCIYSKYYYWALVADQALHFATYGVILAVVAAL